MKDIYNKGFSLIEASITLSVIAVASISMMQLMDNVNAIQEHANDKSSKYSLEQSIRLILDNPKHCDISLQNIPFKKEAIDNNGKLIQNKSAYSKFSEGLDIELWLSNAEGSEATHKKFNGINNAPAPGDPSVHIFDDFVISDIKLVANNGTDPYPEGVTTDTTQVVVLYHKKQDTKEKRIMDKIIIDLEVKIETSAENISEVISCQGSGSPVQFTSCSWIDVSSSHNQTVSCDSEQVVTSIELNNNWSGSEWHKHQYIKSIKCCQVSTI